MIYLLQTDAGIQYPYALGMLRASFPNVSFPEVITDEVAASFGCFPVTTIERPEHDPRTQRLEEGEPVQLDDGTWQQVLTVRDATPEEIAQWDESNRPAPDWGAFKAAIITSPVLEAALMAQGGVPPALMAMPTALEVAQAGDASYLSVCLSRALELGVMPAEAGEVFIQAAEAANLPAEVVELLTTGSPVETPEE